MCIVLGWTIVNFLECSNSSIAVFFSKYHAGKNKSIKSFMEFELGIVRELGKKIGRKCTKNLNSIGFALLCFSSPGNKHF